MKGEIYGQSSLPEQPVRLVCVECGERVDESLAAPHPFVPDEEIAGCPHCFSIDSIAFACWKCDKVATSGYNSKHYEETGYRYVNTCYEHRPGQANG